MSSTNLTNDDTLSIRSMSVDDTPDPDRGDCELSRARHAAANLRGEVTDLRMDMAQLKQHIANAKSELEGPLEDKDRTPALTPASR